MQCHLHPPGAVLARKMLPLALMLALALALPLAQAQAQAQAQARVLRPPCQHYCKKPRDARGLAYCRKPLVQACRPDGRRAASRALSSTP